VGVSKRAPITADQLRNWKLLDRFRREVLPLLAARPLTPTESDERRTLFAEDYFCAFLFAMLNPAVKSLRAFGHASHCRKMRQVCSAPFSPATFSEAQHLFSPEVLGQVVRRLSQQALGHGPGGDPRVRQALAALTAVDGTLLRAVPRMAWTPAPGPTHAVRLHLHFSVFEQVPEAWTITPGKVCERQVFNQTVRPGAMVVADRNFSQSYALLEELRDRGVHFVIRLKDNTVMESVAPECTLTAQDRQAGVVWDRQVRLGQAAHGPDFRVVRVEANGDVFHLITTREDLSAELIGLIYRQRWQIELFFKWIKQHLRIKAFYGLSENAVKTQIWIAVSVYVLVAIVRKRLRLDASLYQILQILSLSLFEKMPILQALQPSDSQPEFPDPGKQLILFDL
jgi:Transposase DDE domain